MLTISVSIVLAQRNFSKLLKSYLRLTMF